MNSASNNFYKRVYCICCEGNETFGDCPLCDNERYFEYEYDFDIEDFMRDFYSETIFNPYWNKIDDEEKLKTLNKELENYFSEDCKSPSTALMK